MNTVGKPGKLGEQIRCVVSVSMLTEGWDANTVTHILGVRAFGTQLLCEQVVGRGLRRSSYAPTRTATSSRSTPKSTACRSRSSRPPWPRSPSRAADPTRVVRAARRAPKLRDHASRVLDGYRIELPDRQRCTPTFTDDVPTDVLDRPTCRPWTENAAGSSAKSTSIDARRRCEARARQEVAFALAQASARRRTIRDRRGPKPWLFPQLRAHRRAAGSTRCVDRARTTRSAQLLLLAELAPTGGRAHLRRDRRAIATAPSDLCCRSLAPFDRTGSPARSTSITTQGSVDDRPSRCQRVTLDGSSRHRAGSRWSMACSRTIDGVAAYVKNDHLGFTIPYIHQGRRHDYRTRLPRTARRPADDVEPLDLIVEVIGQPKRPRPTEGARWTPRATCGCRRSTTTAASAAGATSRSRDTRATRQNVDPSRIDGLRRRR